MRLKNGCFSRKVVGSTASDMDRCECFTRLIIYFNMRGKSSFSHYSWYNKTHLLTSFWTSSGPSPPFSCAYRAMCSRAVMYSNRTFFCGHTPNRAPDSSSDLTMTCPFVSFSIPVRMFLCYKGGVTKQKKVEVLSFINTVSKLLGYWFLVKPILLRP